MDSMTDLDRELSAAMQVEPTPDFAARTRARITADRASRAWQMPTLALAAIASAALVVITASVRPSAPDSIASRDPLLRPREDMLVIAPLPRAVRPVAPVIALAAIPQPSPVSKVVVSRSEMLALQRLFSGATIMPPAPEAAADELSIPKISIDPIPIPMPANSPGERQ